MRDSGGDIQVAVTAAISPRTSEVFRVVILLVPFMRLAGGPGAEA